MKIIQLAAISLFGLASATHLTACADSDTGDDSTCDPDVTDCSGLGNIGDGKADGATGTAFNAQMNDLTIIMPLAKSQTEFDDGYIAASSIGPNGTLFPKTPYSTEFPDPSGPSTTDGQVALTYAHLRVTAIRFDPCFAQIGPITDPSTCLNQIRVIFQSLTYDSSSGTYADDGAVHAFYSLSRADLTAAIREVIALRNANGQKTAMGGLAPHPLLVKQGINGAFGQGLSEILLKYASAKNLTRFTHFQSANLNTAWTFAGFDLTKSGSTLKAKAMIIPTLPQSATSVEFFAGFASPVNGGFTPETTSSDDVALMINITNSKAATKTQNKAAFDAALRIENPNFHSPNTIDCASCHAAELGQVLIGQGVLKFATDANAFVPDAKYVSARSMKQTATVKSQPAGELNLHMLSYRGSSLFIGQRVINETANVLAYVNSTVLRAN